MVFMEIRIGSFRMETDSPSDVHAVTSGGDVPTEGGEEEEDVPVLSPWSARDAHVRSKHCRRRLWNH